MRSWVRTALPRYYHRQAASSEILSIAKYLIELSCCLHSAAQHRNSGLYNRLVVARRPRCCRKHVVLKHGHSGQRRRSPAAAGMCWRKLALATKL